MLLDGFLKKLFTPQIFDPEFVLIDDIDGQSTPLHVPDETSRDKLIHWVNNIKSAQMPNWIGLPNNAEKVVLTVRGNSLLALNGGLLASNRLLRTRAPPQHAEGVGR